MRGGLRRAKSGGGRIEVGSELGYLPAVTVSLRQ
jgi:hypothetical protein